ncbi:MAG: cell envelope integrity protein TolA [Burkholderiales bacterium]|jgi:colicin import membrane protein|nr:cell envelope integrity protein TolA [Burkholderiales bacterium]
MIMSPRQSSPSSVSKRRADFWLALTFAIITNLVFIGLLVFSVSWRNPPPVPVTAELYVPPAPEPKPLPPPPPKTVKPPPEIKPLAQPDPEIAIQKKKEEERRKQEAEEKARQEKLKKEQLEKERLAKEKAAREKAEKERLEREKKEREEREQKAREEEAQRETELQKMLAEQRVRDELQAAQDRWVQSIRIKVKGNLVLPPNIAGNPEAIFLIVQLPTGEVIDAKLQKSSGNTAYDDAVYRAIMKSSPLPKPERTDLFRRELRFVFRPRD